MKLLKKGFQLILFVIGSILLYLIIAVGISKITVNSSSVSKQDQNLIYLSTNGVHSSIILPKKYISKEILTDLQLHYPNHNYLMFGWGNQDFYINTPTWNDLKFKYVFGALFLDTATAMHVTTYPYAQKDWIKVKCNDVELQKLNSYILNTFHLDINEHKTFIPCTTYGLNDSFYKANGSYSFKRTCNTWSNEAFKASGLKASYWTIFDFGLLSNYD